MKAEIAGVIVVFLILAIMYLVSPVHAQSTVPGSDVLNFIFSQGFVFLWVSVALNIVFVPLGIKGIFDLHSWLDKQFLKPRKGYIWARQKMPNDRWRGFWIHPTGREIRFKTFAGDTITESFNSGKGWITYEGNMPVVYLDEMNHQMEIGLKFQSGQISQEEITRSLKAAYDTGKLIGWVDFLKNLTPWFIAILVVAGVVGGIGAYYGYQNQNSLAAVVAKPSVDSGTVASAVVNAIRQNITSGIPTVGG